MKIQADRALPRGTELCLQATVCLFIGAYVVCLLYLASHRYYDPDEFEHLQASWLIYAGMLPYRDFFEHHTPLTYLLNAGMMHLLLSPFGVTDDATAVATVVLLRLVAIVLSCAIASMTYMLGCRLLGRPTGAFAALLLMSSDIFLTKAIEIRPDQLATLVILAAAVAVPHGVSAGGKQRLATAWLALSGALCAIAVMATQKALFAVPGLAVHAVAVARAGGKAPAPVAGAILVGGCIGGLPVLAYLLHEHLLGDFLFHNFLLNAIWPRNYRIGADILRHAAVADPLLLGLLAYGTVILNKRWRDDPATQRLGVVARPFASLSIGLLVIPIAQEQYFFLLLPFVAVIAAWAGAQLLQSIALPWLGWRAAAALAAFTAAAYATGHIAVAASRPDGDAIVKLRYLVTHTPADATVIAGWSAGVAFRRPALYYPFLHNEIRYMISAAQYEGLVAGLRSGAIRPEIIDFDDDCRVVPGLAAVVTADYAPTGVGTLWRRRP